jgi:hypothetical protein
MKTAVNRSTAEAVDVELRYDQLLPPICARCGREATTRIQYQFLKTPSTKRSLSVRKVGFWEVILRILGTNVGGKRSPGQSIAMGGMHSGALGGAVGGVVGGAIDSVVNDPLENRHGVRMPFCDEHKDFRQKAESRGMIANICEIGAFLITVAAVAALVSLGAPVQNPPAGAWIPVALFVTPIWLALMAGLYFVWKQQRIDLDRIVPLEFHTQYMVLGGVSHKFAAGVEAIASEQTKDVDELLDRTSKVQKKRPGSTPDFFEGLK